MCRKRITAQPILFLIIFYTSFTNMKILLLFLLATFVAAESQADIPNPIRLPFAAPIDKLNCLSWRLAVETNNRGFFATVPTKCVSHVADYMQGSQYRDDLDFVAYLAFQYARNIELKEDGKDIWIFDIGDTTLSSLPYYARPEVNFGATKFNSTAYREWLLEGKAPAVPSMVYLYRRLLNLGFKFVFLSGKGEDLKDVTEKNLKKAGFTTWEKVIFKKPSEADTLAFKSKKREELVAQGYRIRGNMGDQWKDLQGNHAGERTFKVPNPMYHVR